MNSVRQNGRNIKDRYLSKVKKRLELMTICIAGICDLSSGPKILFCSDRLVTDSNGLTFEQGTPKIIQVAENCLVMNAGLGSEADEIISNVTNSIILEKTKEKKRYLTIKEIALLFKEEHQKMRNEKINDEILKPRGLSLDSFYANIKSFPDWLGILLDNQISGYAFGVHFLVLGFDMTEAGYLGHIYQINESGETRLLDNIGFGIIGIGDRMSLPELTRETYSYNTPINEAIVRIYWAKKSAERVVSVGSQTTDFGLMYCVINEKKELQIVSTWLTTAFLAQLKKDYDTHSSKITESTHTIQKNIEEMVTGKRVATPPLKYELGINGEFYSNK